MLLTLDAHQITILLMLLALDDHQITILLYVIGFIRLPNNNITLCY